MATIMHQVGIHASAEQVYAALTVIDELRSWWTRDTRGTCQVGGELEFHFGDRHMDIMIVNQQAETLVHWRCVAGDPQWESTEILFRLRDEQDMVMLDFTHGYWREPTELFARCTTKWAVYLLSLKNYLETGSGRPYPDDLSLFDAEPSLQIGAA